MNTKQSHPHPEQLKAFTLGQLEPDNIEEIGQHLTQCEECCETLQTIPGDTFITLIRQSKAGQAQPKPPLPEQTIDLPAAPQPDASSSVNPSLAPTLDAVGANVSTVEATVKINDDLLNHPRYHVVGLLGQGGMGAVYQAEHRMMQRTVALKVINQEFVSNQAAVDRFHREVQTAAKLHHPNIVTAYDAEQAGDTHFLVMEYVPGTDLSEVVKERGPLPVTEACDYIRQTALGLQHAHEQGMVHRDIKPHNLMVAPEGQIKILDFGLASLATETISPEEENPQSVIRNPQSRNLQSSLTEAGTIMGTPDSIAPEQARDTRSVDIRADIYSLGCTFYYLLTGKTPFPDGKPLDKILAHTTEDPTPASELRPDIPAEVLAVLHKMMAKDPADRYQTPAEVAEALASIKPEPRPKPQPKRRWPVIATLATAAALLLLVLSAIVIYVRTSTGTIRIEINDPKIKVGFAGDTYTIDNAGETIWITPGEHSLFVQRGDLSFHTPKFTLGAGENPRLRVEFLQGKLVVKTGDRVFEHAARVVADISIPEDMALAIKAGRGEIVPPEEHPLAEELAKPNGRKLITLFANLPDEAHQLLLKQGYVKWPFAKLDPQRQAVYEFGFDFYLETYKKQNRPTPHTLEDLKNADVGFAVVDFPEVKANLVTLYVLLEDHPVWWPIESVKVPANIPAHKVMLPEVQKGPHSPLPGPVPSISIPEEMGLLIKAGRGEIKLTKDHPLAEEMANPEIKKFIDLFANLPDGAHQMLVNQGYLKWPFAKLDKKDQAVYEYGLKGYQERAKNKGVPWPKGMSFEDLQKADVGFAVTDFPQTITNHVSGFVLFEEKGIRWHFKSVPVPANVPAYHAMLSDVRKNPYSPLPGSVWPNKSPKKEVLLAVKEEDGRQTLELDGQKISPFELVDRLKLMVQKNPDLVVRLNIKLRHIDSGEFKNLHRVVSAVGVRRVMGPPLVEQYFQRKNQLMRIGIALHAYHDSHNQFPPAPFGNRPGQGFDKEGRPLLSWRVHLLPYLEQEDLYKQFHLDEPWDSEHNKKLLVKMPDVFKTTDDPTKTTFLAVVGKGTAYEGKKGLTISSLHDGASTTVITVDAGPDNAVPWTKPEDLPFDREDPIRAFGRSEFGEVFLALFCDGHVKGIPVDIAPESLRAQGRLSSRPRSS